MTETKAVIFDFDGTLVDSLGIWKRVDEIFFGRRGMNFEELGLNFGGRSFSECAVYAKETLMLSESAEEIKREWTELSIELYTDKKMLKPYAKEFVRALKAAGYKTAVGSSSDQRIIRHVVETADMEDDFDLLLTCCEVGKGKPDPAVYYSVAKALSVLPENCIVFEDTLEGVMAGKRAGMYVYAVEEKHNETDRKEIEAMADRYIEGFAYFKESFGVIHTVLPI
ncbi:MAG: HAD family hydrolase [Anaerofustis sp.]